MLISIQTHQNACMLKLYLKINKIKHLFFQQRTGKDDICQCQNKMKAVRSD